MAAKPLMSRRPALGLRGFAMHTRRFLTLALVALVLPLPALAAHAQTTGGASAQPDFVPTALTWSKPFQQGGYIVLNATIHNAGGPANGTQQVAFLVDGALHAITTIANPKPGGNVTLSVPWRVQSGDHRFEVRADSNATYNETDETNNVLAVDASIPWPDLTITSIIVARAHDATGPIYQDEPYSLVVGVTNLGQLATIPTRVSIATDGGAPILRTINPLGPGQSAEAWSGHLQSTLAPGIHQAVVQADANGTVNESDETNNLATLTFEVFALPETDVRVRILGVERPTLRTDLGPIMPNPLARRTILVELANEGTGPILRGGYSVTLEDNRAIGGTRLLTNGNHTLGYGSLPNLAPGERVVLRIPWDPVGFGDTAIVARTWTGTQPDTDPTNDQDRRDDFILVGGLGAGIVPISPRTLG